jgi:hypothetical protein
MVDVIELKEGGITKVGNWSDEKSIQKLTIDRPPYENDARKQALKHKSFRVLISLVNSFTVKLEQILISDCTLDRTIRKVQES